MSITVNTKKDGVKYLKRALVKGTAGTPHLRLIDGNGFELDNDYDLYQHPDGFAILVKRGIFEVGEYKNGKVTVKASKGIE